MYIYSDTEREEEEHALPNVEVFYATQFDCDEWNTNMSEEEDFSYTPGWYYAYGFIGCLWDSEPYGPYESEEEAINAVQNEA